MRSLAYVILSPNAGLIIAGTVGVVAEVRTRQPLPAGGSVTDHLSRCGGMERDHEYGLGRSPASAGTRYNDNGGDDGRGG